VRLGRKCPWTHPGPRSHSQGAPNTNIEYMLNIVTLLLTYLRRYIYVIEGWRQGRGRVARLSDTGPRHRSREAPNISESNATRVNPRNSCGWVNGLTLTPQPHEFLRLCDCVTITAASYIEQIDDRLPPLLLIYICNRGGMSMDASRAASSQPRRTLAQKTSRGNRSS